MKPFSDISVAAGLFLLYSLLSSRRSFCRLQSLFSQATLSLPMDKLLSRIPLRLEIRAYSELSYYTIRLTFVIQDSIHHHRSGTLYCMYQIFSLPSRCISNSLRTIARFVFHNVQKYYLPGTTPLRRFHRVAAQCSHRVSARPLPTSGRVHCDVSSLVHTWSKRSTLP